MLEYRPLSLLVSGSAKFRSSFATASRVSRSGVWGGQRRDDGLHIRPLIPRRQFQACDHTAAVGVTSFSPDRMKIQALWSCCASSHVHAANLTFLRFLPHRMGKLKRVMALDENDQSAMEEEVKTALGVCPLGVQLVLRYCHLRAEPVVTWSAGHIFRQRAAQPKDTSCAAAAGAGGTHFESLPVERAASSECAVA